MDTLLGIIGALSHVGNIFSETWTRFWEAKTRYVEAQAEQEKAKQEKEHYEEMKKIFLIVIAGLFFILFIAMIK